MLSQHTGLFGDTMNTASRMETTCPVGCIQVSEATYELLQATGAASGLVSTGGVDVKGKGRMVRALTMGTCSAGTGWCQDGARFFRQSLLRHLTTQITYTLGPRMASKAQVGFSGPLLAACSHGALRAPTPRQSMGQLLLSTADLCSTPKLANKQSRSTQNSSATRLFVQSNPSTVRGSSTHTSKHARAVDLVLALTQARHDNVLCRVIW
jgi:hypothetical protein